MKKKTSEDLDDDLRPHYDFDYSKMKRNPYAGEKKVYKRTFVTLDCGYRTPNPQRHRP